MNITFLRLLPLLKAFSPKHPKVSTRRKSIAFDVAKMYFSSNQKEENLHLDFLAV